MDAGNVEALRGRLRSLGFDVVRFAKIAPEGAPGSAALDRWLLSGFHADMAWMERTADKRRDPALVLPGVASMILLGVNYGCPEEEGGEEPKGGLRWARYARHEDYHDTMKEGLVAAGRILEETLGLGQEDYRYYVDAGPVLERGWAARAGVGFIGKNGMLVSSEYGNWLFLAALLVRAELPADMPFRSGRFAAGCGHCTRCLDVCPTQAFVAPGVVDARRCVSYLTIEHKGAIPEEFREAVGDRIYGCDACAEVCPWNRFAREARSTLLVARREFGRMPLSEILGLTPERFAKVFRRTPVKRLKLERLLRNACVAAGNSRAPELRGALENLLKHESELVREHAAWALRRLREVP